MRSDKKQKLSANIMNFTSLVRNNGAEERILSIPIYQRPYRWGLESPGEKENLVYKLIEDHFLCQSSTAEHGHFAGAIVCANQSPEDHSDNRFNGFLETALVDGQQRCTTLFIINFVLLSACRLWINNSSSIKGDWVEDVKDFISNLNYYYLPLYRNCFALDLSDIRKTINSINKKQPSQRCEEDKVQLYEIWNNSLCIEHHLQSSVDLRLYYDRSPLNKELRDILKRFQGKFYFDEENIITVSNNSNLFDCDGLSKFQESLVGAILSITKGFKDILKCFDQSYQFIEEAITILGKTEIVADDINEDLNEKNLELCVIETDNTQDAYALFEVLNDRSLALEQHELIKNAIYRSVDKNSEQNEKWQKIEELDIIWNDSVGLVEAPTLQKEVFNIWTGIVTGKSPSPSVTNKIHTYISDHIKADGKYCYASAKKDFELLKSVFQVFSNLPVNKRLDSAFRATYQQSRINDDLHNKNIYFQRAFLLSHALKTNNITAGILSLEFNYEGVPKVKKEAIYRAIFICSMLGDDFSLAHEITKKIVEKKDFADIKDTSIRLLNTDLINDVLHFTKSKRYEKIKFLLAELTIFSSRKKGGTGSSCFEFSPELSLDIDHIEPEMKNVVRNSSQGYFLATNEVNLDELCNLTLLDYSSNRSKNKEPVCKAIPRVVEAYSGKVIDAGKEDYSVTQFIADGLIEIFKSCRVQVGTDKKLFAPTKEFFSQRKKYLENIINEYFNSNKQAIIKQLLDD